MNHGFPWWLLCVFCCLALRLPRSCVAVASQGILPSAAGELLPANIRRAAAMRALNDGSEWGRMVDDDDGDDIKFGKGRFIMAIPDGLLYWISVLWIACIAGGISVINYPWEIHINNLPHVIFDGKSRAMCGKCFHIEFIIASLAYWLENWSSAEPKRCEALKVKRFESNRAPCGSNPKMQALHKPTL